MRYTAAGFVRLVVVMMFFFAYQKLVWADSRIRPSPINPTSFQSISVYQIPNTEHDLRVVIHSDIDRMEYILDLTVDENSVLENYTLPRRITPFSDLSDLGHSVACQWDQSFRFCESLRIVFSERYADRQETFLIFTVSIYSDENHWINSEASFEISEIPSSILNQRGQSN